MQWKLVHQHPYFSQLWYIRYQYTIIQKLFEYSVRLFQYYSLFENLNIRTCTTYVWSIVTLLIVVLLQPALTSHIIGWCPPLFSKREILCYMGEYVRILDDEISQPTEQYFYWIDVFIFLSTAISRAWGPRPRVRAQARHAYRPQTDWQKSSHTFHSVSSWKCPAEPPSWPDRNAWRGGFSVDPRWCSPIDRWGSWNLFPCQSQRSCFSYNSGQWCKDYEERSS